MKCSAKAKLSPIYLVDSFGSLYSEQIRYMMAKYMRIAHEFGKEIGIHAHNNLQLAFANTIEAIVCGANMVDGTLAGLGRGGGELARWNCSWASSTTRVIESARCSNASKRKSSRCAQSSAGASTTRT